MSNFYDDMLRQHFRGFSQHEDVVNDHTVSCQIPFLDRIVSGEVAYSAQVHDALRKLRETESLEDNSVLQSDIYIVETFLLANNAFRVNEHASLMYCWANLMFESFDKHFRIIDEAGTENHISANSSVARKPKRNFENSAPGDLVWLHKTGRAIEDIDAHMVTLQWMERWTEGKKISGYPHEYIIDIREDFKDIAQLEVSWGNGHPKFEIKNQCGQADIEAKIIESLCTTSLAEINRRFKSPQDDV
jgi:hypothetical protein